MRASLWHFHHSIGRGTGATAFTMVTIWVLLTTVHRVVHRMLFSRKDSSESILFLWGWGPEEPHLGLWLPWAEGGAALTPPWCCRFNYYISTSNPNYFKFDPAAALTCPSTSDQSTAHERVAPRGLYHCGCVFNCKVDNTTEAHIRRLCCFEKEALHLVTVRLHCFCRDDD